MLKKKDFKALVGKELKVILDDDVSVPIKVESIEDLPAPETDDENVRKDPFRVMFSTALDCRLPEGTVQLSDGIDAEIALSCCCEVGAEVERICYDANFS